MSDFKDEFTKELTNIIKNMNTENNEIPVTETNLCADIELSTYTTIKEYTERTGKRFRISKEQKIRGMSRTEAFNETFGGKKLDSTEEV